MARPREFDTDAVREAAIRCFWTRGYEATSIKDLLEETGITAASLYNAFGDKETLFRGAFEHYIETGINARLRRFETLPPRQAIGAFFEDIVQRSLADPEHKGCMVVNSALELAPHDAHLRTVITEVFDRIESFFLRCLRAGQADGTINAALGARNLARSLMTVLMGLRVLARVRPEKALLEGALSPVLALLEPGGQ
jgi:TetR/AcrR family transcriptional repressor of nem operon